MSQHSFFSHSFLRGFVMSRVQHILSRMPDADDALRRLANVIPVPAICRKDARRSDRRCIAQTKSPSDPEGLVLALGDAIR